MKRKSLIIILSLTIFVSCFFLGMRISRNEPLWVDEIYSQTRSIATLSYKEIIFGKIQEGNISPLFYLIQKALCDIFDYHTPAQWLKGDFTYQDADARTLLRINPVFFISASVMLIFFYFSRYHSLLAGIYSVFISFSSYMLWGYWAEARLCALWFFLTTAQTLTFLYLMKDNINRFKPWLLLIIINILLSMTIFFSLSQILIISVLLWLFKYREFKQYIFLTFVPVVIALAYYFNSPKYDFYLGLEPGQLIRDCFSRDRLYILLIFLFFIIIYLLEQRSMKQRLFKDSLFTLGLPIFCFAVMMIAANVFLIFILKIKGVPGQGFAVVSRYFIGLTPVGIISTTFLSFNIVKVLSRVRLVQFLVFLGIADLVMVRFVKMVPHIKNILS